MKVGRSTHEFPKIGMSLKLVLVFNPFFSSLFWVDIFCCLWYGSLGNAGVTLKLLWLPLKGLLWRLTSPVGKRYEPCRGSSREEQGCLAALPAMETVLLWYFRGARTRRRKQPKDLGYTMWISIHWQLYSFQIVHYLFVSFPPYSLFPDLAWALHMSLLS